MDVLFCLNSQSFRILCLYFRIGSIIIGSIIIGSVIVGSVISIKIFQRWCGSRSCRSRWHTRGRAWWHINVAIRKIEEIIGRNRTTSSRILHRFDIVSTNELQKLKETDQLQFSYHGNMKVECWTFGPTLFIKSLSLSSSFSDSSVDELELDWVSLFTSESSSELLLNELESSDGPLAPFFLRTGTETSI